jgi:serine/threonine-protein kinase
VADPAELVQQPTQPETAAADVTTIAPTTARSKPDPLIGTVMEGRYEVLARIGAGGMGAVYRARQAAMDRIVAVKVLLRSLASNEINVRRFQQEARAASRLNHPNTITIHDFGQAKDGTLYIVMEFLEGDPLDRVIAREKPLAPERTVRIMAQVCRSLAEAHDAGIIHRDLKPDNIFLLNRGNEPDFVKVLDFGVAKLKDPGGTGDSAGTLTQAGMIFGTPKYMSPEQAQSLDLDPTSDLYALGVIMYEMLTGTPPFTGDAPLTILIKHVHEQPPPLPPGLVPPALEAVVLKALQKDRRLRQQSATELRRELEDALLTFAARPSEVLLQVGTGVAPVATWTGSVPAAGGSGYLPAGYPAPLPGAPSPAPRPADPSAAWDFSGEEAATPPPAPSPRPGSKRLPLVAALLLLLGGGAAAWFFAGPRPPAPAAAPDAGPRPAAAALAAKPPADDLGPPGRPDGGVVTAASPDATSPSADAGPPATASTAPPSRRPPPESRPTPGKTPPPEGSGGDVRAPGGQVRLKVTSAPPGAMVLVNGVQVGLTPTTLFRPKGLIPITLVVKKSGYRDGSTIADLRHDQQLNVQLEPLTPSTPTAALPTGGSVSPPPPTPAPTPPPPPPPTPPGKDDKFGKFGDFKPLQFGD